MSLRIYNTAARRKEDFTPREPGKVALYVCGPTVYNYIHIGNARTFLSFDVIRRYLQWRGFEVTFVQNITDIDDKIINRAAEEGKAPAEIAAFYTKAFIDEMHALGVEDPTLRPRATESIGDMIALIERLIKRGHAYESGGDVYFAVRSWPGYGQLSGRALDELQSGARVEVSELKRDPLDFTLWKAAKPGEPFWDSPWGQGRPGWHIECSAMSERDLGLPIDIHGGGGDLIFPHHENERAQAEAATGTTFVNYWMHGGMLNINDEKMSKSLGNFLLLHEVLEHYEPAVLRLLMLQTHYRSPLDFSDARLEEAKAALERLRGFVSLVEWRISFAANPDKGVPLSQATEAARAKFTLEMDDDFNTAGALAALFELMRATNVWLDAHQGELGEDECANLAEVAATMCELLGVLGIDLIAGGSGSDQRADEDEQAQSLLVQRTEARAAKDWARADALRDELDKLGYVIEDTPQGPRLVRT
ncbi:MAG: cysteine--tRNA ligase [Coriobacteriia bacterium]|nr:cysteine--tRNA ligase [Coriobacteriia bacterium]